MSPAMAAPTPPVGLSPAQLGAMLQSPAAPPATVTCSTCGSSNEGRLRFCMTCGSRLQEAAAAQPAPAAMPQPAPQPAPAAAPQPAPAAMPQYQPAPQPALAQALGVQAPPQPAPAPAPQASPAPAAPLVPQPIVNSGGHDAPTPFTGAPIAPTCARCKGVNEPSSTFCRYCGAPLANAPPRQHTEPVPARVETPKPADVTTSPPPAPAAAPPPAAAEPAPAAPEPAPAAAAASPTSSQVTNKVDAEPLNASLAEKEPTPAAPAPAEPVRESKVRGRVVVVAKDGSESASFPLQERVDVGRFEGELRFPEDPYLTARHLRIYERDGQFFIKDLGTLNGTFLRLRDGESVAIEPGAHFLVGQQLLRLVGIPQEEEIPAAAREHGVLLFGTPPFPRYARLEQRSVEGTTLDVYHLHKTETVMGRESGDVVFSDDAFLSRRHAALRFDKATRKFELVDLHSSNGSFARINGEVELRHRDQVRIGQQLLRIELDDHAGKKDGTPRSKA